MSGRDVVCAILEAKTAGQKAAATRRLNRLVVERAAATGADPKWIRAGFKARVSRLQNGR